MADIHKQENYNIVSIVWCRNSGPRLWRLNGNSRGVSHKIPLRTRNRNQLLMINVTMHEIRLLVLTKTFINIGSNTKLNSASKWHYSLFESHSTVCGRIALYPQIRRHTNILLYAIGNTNCLKWQPNEHWRISDIRFIVSCIWTPREYTINWKWIQRTNIINIHPTIYEQHISLDDSGGILTVLTCLVYIMWLWKTAH